MPNGIRRLSKQYLNNPAEVTVKSQQRTNDNIKQRFLLTAHRAKLDAFTRILEVTDYDAMIVFCRTKHETEEVAEKLRDAGYNAAAINGDIAQNQRERTVDQLKDGRLDILVATDVAARGLDVDASLTWSTSISRTILSLTFTALAVPAARVVPARQSCSLLLVSVACCVPSSA